MITGEIINKLLTLCSLLRNEGLTYHQYVTELTYIIFLKMLNEIGEENLLQHGYRWEDLKSKSGVDLKNFYKELLKYLGENSTGIVQQIYQGSTTNIEEPKYLEKIISTIDELDWYLAKEEGFPEFYDELLEKSAYEKKMGIGQYFTPKPLVNIMVKLIDPKPGERCNDPAAGNFGFMVETDKYMKGKYDNYWDVESDDLTGLQEFQRTKAFSGCELVHETHRLALMNAMIHDIDGNLILGDTLTNVGIIFKDLDVVLSKVPFGTKKGVERSTRDDLTFITTNKQLNFLQHIYRSLKANGKARAAVILTDSTLSKDGVGSKIRKDLMDKCNLHTILRLPTGIFHSKEVKTNVLFFTRGESNKENTREIWYYDLRTNMPKFNKSNPLTEDYFEKFIKAYTAENRGIVEDNRWCKYTREEIKDNKDSLDLGLINKNFNEDYEEVASPIESAEEALLKLEEATKLLINVINNQKLNTVDKNFIEKLTNIELQIHFIKQSILSNDFKCELGTNFKEEESALELLKEILSKN